MINGIYLFKTRFHCHVTGQVPPVGLASFAWLNLSQFSVIVHKLVHRLVFKAAGYLVGAADKRFTCRL
jgi:hypothetical protein